MVFFFFCQPFPSIVFRSNTVDLHASRFLCLSPLWLSTWRLYQSRYAGKKKDRGCHAGVQRPWKSDSDCRQKWTTVFSKVGPAVHLFVVAAKGFCFRMPS